MPEEIRADLLLGRDTLSPGLLKAGAAASDASSNVRQLTRDLYEVGKQRATPIVDLQDTAATAKLAEVSQKLRDLGAKAASPSIDVNDKGAQAAVAGMRVKLDALGRKVASPRITLEGLARAEAGILTLDAQLDRLDHKHATATVSVDRGGLLSRLGGLFGGGGAGAGGAGAAGGLGAAGPIGIGAAIAAALALAPAAIPVGLGGLVGGGGALGALKIGAAAEKQLQAMQKSLHNITGTTAASKAARDRLQAQIAAFEKTNADQLQFGRAGQSFTQSLTGTFLGALTARTPGFSAGPRGQPGGSFLSGLVPILQQLSGFVKSIGPQLAGLFRASLPFVSAFVKVMEQFAKAVLPAVTQSLKIMAPDLPVITQGFKFLAEGIAGFLHNLGPGMKDSAIIFKAAMLVIKGVLQLTGLAASAFAIAIVKTAEFVRAAARDIPPAFDKMRHETAVIFDTVRHDIARTWDLIWQDTAGKVIRGTHSVEHQFDAWRHGVAVIFSGTRHDIAATWDLIWRTTAGQVQRGLGTVVSWFRGLPSRVLGALFGLGHQLYAFAHAALNEFWSGLKSVAGSILGWVGNFVSTIWNKVKSFFGIASPSSLFYDIGKNLMLGLFHGIKDHAHHAVNAARNAASAAGGPVSASAAQAQAYARSRLAAYGWGASQMAPLIALWNQESGWNRFARNPSSGAYGIPQALPPSKMGAAANPPTSSAAAQINWGLGYIRSVYGSPAGAWAHERAFNWYGTGLTGGVFSQPTVIGVGERGPELVNIRPLHGPGGAEQRIILEFRGGTEGPLTAALMQMIRHQVRVRGGGNVQVALGRP